MQSSEDDATHSKPRQATVWSLVRPLLAWLAILAFVFVILYLAGNASTGFQK